MVELIMAGVELSTPRTSRRLLPPGCRKKIRKFDLPNLISTET